MLLFCNQMKQILAMWLESVHSGKITRVTFHIFIIFFLKRVEWLILHKSRIYEICQFSKFLLGIPQTHGSVIKTQFQTSGPHVGEMMMSVHWYYKPEQTVSKSNDVLKGEKVRMVCFEPFLLYSANQWRLTPKKLHNCKQTHFSLWRSLCCRYCFLYY